jgi:solute carrier family 25 aspartate/glutamate transporter 12/13
MLMTDMTDLTKAKEVVKESLLGTEVPEDIQLSAQSRANFEKNARKDSGSEELYMSEVEFINAIAPEGEDYVSHKKTQTYCCEAID